MKATTITVLKKELQHLPEEELITLCLSLAKFKKENKELLTYLLFEAGDEEAFIEGVKEEVSRQFAEIKSTSIYLVKKSVRKILRNIKKNIRYSKKKETEIQLLMHFCEELKNMGPLARRSTLLMNIFERQIKLCIKAISYLHEDLQYDYKQEVKKLLSAI